MAGERGGLAAERTLLQRSEPSSGFAERWQCGALDLSAVVYANLMDKQSVLATPQCNWR